jgi:hypothetical protein
LQFRNWPFSASHSDNAIVVKHYVAISCYPNITFESVGTKLQTQLECLNRVLRGMSTSTTVRKGNGFIDQGGKALLHA